MEITLEEIHRVYWIQIILMSVAAFRGNIQMCLTNVCTISIIQFHKERIV